MCRKISFCFVILLFIGCENSHRAGHTRLCERPDIRDYVNETFSIDEVQDVEDALQGFIDTSMFYNLWMTNDMERAESEILEPTLINSTYTRSLSILANRSIREKDGSVSIGWIVGFRHEGDWYFFRTSKNLYLQVGVVKKAIMSFDDLHNWAHEKEMRGYLKYEGDSCNWKINDDYFKNYMDNIEYAPEMQQLGSEGFKEGPDSYWTTRYMLFQKMMQRRINLTKNEWKRQDELFEDGMISEEVYNHYLKLRIPTSDDEWDEVEEFHKIFRKDSMIRSFMNELIGELPKKSFEMEVE